MSTHPSMLQESREWQNPFSLSISLLFYSLRVESDSLLLKLENWTKKEWPSPLRAFFFFWTGLTSEPTLVFSFMCPIPAGREGLMMSISPVPGSVGLTTVAAELSCILWLTLLVLKLIFWSSVWLLVSFLNEFSKESAESRRDQHP